MYFFIFPFRVVVAVYSFRLTHYGRHKLIPALHKTCPNPFYRKKIDGFRFNFHGLVIDVHLYHLESTSEMECCTHLFLGNRITFLSGALTLSFLSHCIGSHCSVSFGIKFLLCHLWEILSLPQPANRILNGGRIWSPLCIATVSIINLFWKM